MNNNDLTLLSIAVENLLDKGIVLLNDDGTANADGVAEYQLLTTLANAIEEISKTSRTNGIAVIKALGLENQVIDGITANIQLSKVADSWTIDSKRLQVEDPATYEKYKKAKKGYETLKISSTKKKN